MNLILAQAGEAAAKAAHEPRTALYILIGYLCLLLGLALFSGKFRHPNDDNSVFGRLKSGLLGFELREK